MADQRPTMRSRRSAPREGRSPTLKRPSDFSETVVQSPTECYATFSGFGLRHALPDQKDSEGQDRSDAGLPDHCTTVAPSDIDDLPVVVIGDNMSCYGIWRRR